MSGRSHRGVWLWLCGWLLAAGFAVWHASAVDLYLDRVSATRFSAEVLATPLQRVPLAIAPDGQVWVRHAIALAERGEWRLRSTDIDNAPEGRGIYWNSGWALWLEACGRLRAATTGQPLPTAIEEASEWANLPLFLTVMTLASAWAGRRWGGAAGAVMALGLAGHRGFYAGFYPAYADHHGLINACVLGLVLGLAMAGAGWRRSEQEREGAVWLPDSEAQVMRAITVSAVCGALGMWVSAASLVVMIAFAGLAGIAAGFMFSSGVAVPAAWRRWGRTGALVSTGLYLLENFPDRPGMRLEANHPLYAAAWWGAGEAISAVISWRGGARSRAWLLKRLCGWGIVILAAPLTVAIKGADVFAPLDPFLARIHESIHEFSPVWVEAERAGWGGYRDQAWMLAGLVVLAGAWIVVRRREPEARLVTWAGLVVIATLGMGVWQNRWLMIAGAAQVVLGVLLMVVLSMRMKAGWRGPVAVCAGLAVFAPGAWTLGRERMKVERVRDVQMGETRQLLYRDIASALRRAGAGEESIVLSDPNASVGVGYYGQLRTVGTLYWENRDGLEEAARLIDASDDADAGARMHARGITHVALVSSYDFQAEYHYALSGDKARAGAADGLGRRLLYEHRVPVWLRPINYRVPAPLAPLGFKVALFAVDFEAPVAVARERIGRYQLSKGERKLAEANFMGAMAADPARPEAWLRLGELALADGRLAEAYRFIRAGIERAPEGERDRLAGAAAGLFARAGATREAEALNALKVK